MWEAKEKQEREVRDKGREESEKGEEKGVRRVKMEGKRKQEKEGRNQ